MLGDGVNQFVNPRYHNGPPLRAVPHAMRMPDQAASEARVWYGRMFLPPTDALSHREGVSYGEIRDLTQETHQKASAGADSVLSIGCSRPSKFVPQAEGGADAACAANQMYCWMRCMNYTDDANPTACAAKGLGFNCTDQFDQVWVSGHGDYWPSCTNSTQLTQPLDPIPSPSPGQAEACAPWDTFSSAAGYNMSTALGTAGRTKLMWNVVGDEIQVKMVHSARAGWLALGAENVGGDHNGMNGASVVIGRFDPVQGNSVGEYTIPLDRTAFRWWIPAKTSSLSGTELSVDGCYTTLKFTTKQIDGVSLNVTSNRMIWALTEQSVSMPDFAAYHAPRQFNISEQANYRGHLLWDMPHRLPGTTSGAGAPDTRVVLLGAVLVLSVLFQQA